MDYTEPSMCSPERATDLIGLAIDCSSGLNDSAEPIKSGAVVSTGSGFNVFGWLDLTSSQKPSGVPAQASATALSVGQWRSALSHR